MESALMPTVINIRKLNEDDWQIFRSVRLKALQSDPSVFGSNYQKESQATESDWRERLRTDDAAVFLVYDGAGTLGMTGIAIDRNDPTKKQAILWGSWLEPHARGKGLSQMMYKARIDWATEHPTVDRIIVSHRASNLASKHANQKHGFIFTHKEAQVWPDGTQEDRVFYYLPVKYPPARMPQTK
jgi:RimJ/RimL family protein N-acetyltransferase